MIQNRKSAYMFDLASRPVIEAMEDRRLFSAMLSLSSSLMVFNAVSGTTSQTETLTLTNSGDAPLSLGNSSIVDDPSSANGDPSRFSVTNSGSVPASLAVGQSFDLQLQFNANAVVTNGALLDISSSDPAAPTETVTLHGIGTRGLGGSNQPSLATILQAYDIPTIVGLGPNDADASTDTTYPEPPDPTSQEVVMQRFVKAGTGPVTIQTLASFTAAGTKPYTLGTYNPANPTLLNELFFTPSSEYQSTYVQPEGATSFDPGSGQFGFYFLSNVQVKGRVGYSEDALNTWDTTDPRKMRFFPLENPDGSVVPNAYILTSTEWNAPVGYDFTNIVAIVRNVKAAPSAPAAASISLRNENALPGSANMIFSRIQSPNTSIGDIEHDSGILQVTNTGDAPLIISSYTISSAWQLSNPPAFPVTVQPQAQLNLTVKFIATSHGNVPYNETNSPAYPGGGGEWAGTLNLNSNDPNNPTATQDLTGWWQLHSENSNEPSLQTQINLLAGYSTDINPTPISELTESMNTTGSSPTYYGEEVVSAYWQAADTGQQVTVDQIGAYHTEGNVTQTYFTNSTSSGSTLLMTTANDSGQSMIPILKSSNNASNPAIAYFSTTGIFGWRVDAEYSDNSKNSFATGGGHHFRFYPVRTAAGNLLPNTYIMCMDYSNTPQNFDFQDNVYIVSNIRPVTVVSGITAPQTTGAPAAPSDFYAINATGGNLLQWGASLASSLTGYNIYRATSSAGPYTLITSSPLPAGDLTYTDTTTAATGTSYYQVTAVSPTGESLGATTSVTNNGSSNGGGAGAPVAAAETRSTLAGTAVVINEVADASDNSLGTIVPSSVIITTAAGHGTTSVDPTTGAITYTPAAGFTGVDTFQYTISDTTGATSAAATITINVSATVVGNPIAANFTLVAAADGSLTIDVVGSATDATATIDPTSVVITQEPTHGSAAVDSTTGKIIYTPAPGYVGPDKILYTVGDNLGAVSGAATIALSVKLGGPTSADLSATTVFSTPVTVDVVAAATDLSGTVSPTSVTITTSPIHGSATIDPTTGAITYTPTGNFVGADSLQYTLSDDNHTVSNNITLSINVGVVVNAKTKSLSFVDGNGNTVTITLAGNGNAEVFFTGSGSATTVTTGGKVTVLGAGLGIASISATGTTISSSLTISRKGVAAIDIGSISVAGPINKIVATTTTITGALSVSGAMSLLQLGGATGASITIGSASATAGGFQLIIGSAIDTTLTSAIPIRSIKATSWAATTAGDDSITAPSIASLVTTGNFDADITTTGGKPFSLGTVHIGGQVGGDNWNITGPANSIYAGSMAAGWTGHFTGTLNSFTIHSEGFPGTLTATTIKTISFTGGDTGAITAGSITSAKVTGAMTGASLTLTNPLSGKLLDLGHLAVTGMTTNSTITSAGNIGSVASGGFSGSSIDAGIIAGVTLPSALSDIASSAAIGSIVVTGRGATFANTDIGAQSVGSLTLGNILTTNNGVSFGVGAGTIKSLSGTLDSGPALHLNSITLLSSASIATYVQDHSLTLNSFEIVPGV